MQLNSTILLSLSFSVYNTPAQHHEAILQASARHGSHPECLSNRTHPILVGVKRHRGSIDG